MFKKGELERDKLPTIDEFLSVALETSNSINEDKSKE